MEVIRDLIQQYNLLVWIAGILTPYLTNKVKVTLGWKKRAALGLSVVIAGILAVLSLWVDGSLVKWEDIGINASAIFAIATVYYKTFIKP